VTDDTGGERSTDGEADAQLLAGECGNGHLTSPPRESCPTCGADRTGTVDLSDREGEVRTWTTSTATPRGVREPNTLAVVVFTVGGEDVRVLGQTTGAVAVGDRVRPVFVGQLRDPDAGIRVAESQQWDGFRFKPV
jgi:Predicted nucleic-acid-binding protein containing a Zn-ribbon